MFWKRYRRYHKRRQFPFLAQGSPYGVAKLYWSLDRCKLIRRKSYNPYFGVVSLEFLFNQQESIQEGKGVWYQGKDYDGRCQRIKPPGNLEPFKEGLREIFAGCETQRRISGGEISAEKNFIFFRAGETVLSATLGLTPGKNYSPQKRVIGFRRPPTFWGTQPCVPKSSLTKSARYPHGAVETHALRFPRGPGKYIPITAGSIHYCARAS